MEDLFELRCRGVQTARDAVVYDWNPDKLETRVTRFIAAYNAEVHRHRAEPTSDWPDQIDWSRNLKRDARGGKLASFDAAKIRAALYRPFSKRWLFFDGILSESDPNREDDPVYFAPGGPGGAGQRRNRPDCQSPAGLPLGPHRAAEAGTQTQPRWLSLSSVFTAFPLRSLCLRVEAETTRFPDLPTRETNPVSPN